MVDNLTWPVGFPEACYKMSMGDVFVDRSEDDGVCWYRITDNRIMRRIKRGGLWQECGYSLSTLFEMDWYPASVLDDAGTIQDNVAAAFISSIKSQLTDSHDNNS